MYIFQRERPDARSDVTHRSVFAQLAERREGFLVGLANPVNHLLRVWTQHVTLRALLLLLVLLLLVSVISDR